MVSWRVNYRRLVQRPRQVGGGKAGTDGASQSRAQPQAALNITVFPPQELLCTIILKQNDEVVLSWSRKTRGNFAAVYQGKYFSSSLVETVLVKKKKRKKPISRSILSNIGLNTLENKGRAFLNLDSLNISFSLRRNQPCFFLASGKDSSIRLFETNFQIVMYYSGKGSYLKQSSFPLHGRFQRSAGVVCVSRNPRKHFGSERPFLRTKMQQLLGNLKSSQFTRYRCELSCPQMFERFQRFREKHARLFKSTLNSVLRF